MPQDELKSQILERAVQQVLLDHQVPYSQHLTVLRKLEEATRKHGDDLQAWQEASKSHQTHEEEMANIIDDLRSEIERLKTIAKGEPGDNGLDGIAPTLEEVIAAVIPHIPEPVPGKPGTPGAPGVNGISPNIDYTLLTQKVIEALKADNTLELGHIKGAQDFIMRTSQKTVRVKMEELMRGGGSSSGGSTPLIPTGIVNAVNTVFGVTSEPSSVVADGIIYYDGHGYTFSGSNITMDIPPSQYIRYYV